MKLFVYGSLRKGEHNHDLLMTGGPERVGLIRNTRMYSLGSYPCIVESPDYRDVVHGEVYEIDEDVMFGMLEPMESGAGYFLKGVCVLSGPPVVHGEESWKLDAWAYFYRQHVADSGELPRIKSGDWSKRSKEGL